MTRKYDCEKTRDCIHEYHRLCDSHPAGCESDCPFIGIEESCGFDIFESEDKIALLQKWSDEHPEPPKLTPEERAFVAAFKVKDSKRIERRHGKVYVVSMYGSQEFEIWPSLFKFIEEGEHVPLTELMQLEVEVEK